MALTQTQGYKDYQNEGKIYSAASSLVRVKDNLVRLKTELEATCVVIAADANADADLKTLGTQANNFITNTKITDFITFIVNNLE